MKCMAVLILSLQFFPVFPSRSIGGIGGYHPQPLRGVGNLIR